MFLGLQMSNGEEDSDCGEDDEIWEEEGGYLVISADKVSFFLALHCLVAKFWTLDRLQTGANVF